MLKRELIFLPSLFRLLVALSVISHDIRSCCIASVNQIRATVCNAICSIMRTFGAQCTSDARSQLSSNWSLSCKPSLLTERLFCNVPSSEEVRCVAYEKYVVYIMNMSSCDHDNDYISSFLLERGRGWEISSIHISSLSFDDCVVVVVLSFLLWKSVALHSVFRDCPGLISNTLNKDGCIAVQGYIL